MIFYQQNIRDCRYSGYYGYTAVKWLKWESQVITGKNFNSPNIFIKQALRAPGTGPGTGEVIQIQLTFTLNSSKNWGNFIRQLLSAAYTLKIPSK